ncbi:MAG: gamma-glutamyltransferase [Candidatus Lambdaproteobacteria bacterium]|nr:gamma-glutamyltransferase [Candidatus Lambdaproteobacteria bacterium]
MRLAAPTIRHRLGPSPHGSRHSSARVNAPPLVLLLALLLPWAGSAWAQGAGSPEAADPAGRQVAHVSAPVAMVAAAHPLAVEAGLELLRAGGNAVDAALATVAALNVVEPQSSGIGGGGFIVIHLRKENRFVAIDGREESPAAIPANMFMGPDGKPIKFFPDRVTGGHAVGVPGLVSLLAKAAHYGRLPLSRSLQPAIRLAERGFSVSGRLSRTIGRQRSRIRRFPATAAVFLDESGQPLQAGTLLRQPELARTLRLIAEGGARAFYRGEVAADIVRAVRESPVAPGVMSADDLAAYEAVRREPVRGTYRGYTIVGMGPPCSGPLTLILALNLLERFKPAEYPPDSPQAVHRFVQAMRLAYADRSRHVADPDFAAVPIAGLLDKGYAAGRAAAHDWSGPLRRVSPGQPPGAASAGAAGTGEGADEESPSTTHLSVVDGERNLVSFTATIEQAFGSGVLVAGRGFLLNNQLSDFTVPPSDAGGRPAANRAEGGRKPRRTALDNPAAQGGKRTRSSTTPILVFKEGKPVLVLGSPGGSRIIQYVAWVLLRVLDHGIDLQTAISRPLVVHDRGRTTVEPGLGGPDLSEALDALGHRVRQERLGSGLHGIWIDPATGTLHGGADPRREGIAAGY